MSQASNSEARQAPADVATSLFWDDVRTGLKVVSVGVILLLIGEIGTQFRFHGFFVGATVIIGAVMTLGGLGICTAIPKATGLRNVALGTAGCAALGTLALLVYQFYPDDLPTVAKIAVVLGAVALVLFALLLRGAATYIGHRVLTAAGRSLVSVATGFAVLLVVVCVTEWVDNPALRLLVDLLAIGLVGMLVYVTWGTSDAILRARLGQPLEAPRFTLSAEYLAAEEQRLARENIFYAPPPPPHFSENEVHFFHADDAKAAGAIVVLMAGIFTVGIVLYLIVAWSVVS
jgi:hypothetical protein